MKSDIGTVKRCQEQVHGARFVDRGTVRAFQKQSPHLPCSEPEPSPSSWSGPRNVEAPRYRGTFMAEIVALP
jgi:hypothetical protein